MGELTGLAKGIRPIVVIVVAIGAIATAAGGVAIAFSDKADRSELEKVKSRAVEVEHDSEMRWKDVDYSLKAIRKDQRMLIRAVAPELAKQLGDDG